MSDEKKHIINLGEASGLSDNDYIMIDSASNGARKFKARGIVSGTFIDDTQESLDTTYSSSKIEDLLDDKTSIDDTQSSVSNTYSSSKIEDLVDDKTSIDDTQSSATTTYSSSKIEDLLANIQPSGGGGVTMPWVKSTTVSTWDYNPLNYNNYIHVETGSGETPKGVIFDLTPYNLEAGKTYTFSCDFYGNTVAYSSSNYACNFKYTNSASPAVEQWNTGNYFIISPGTNSLQQVAFNFTADASNNYIIFNCMKFSNGGGTRISKFKVEEWNIV